MTPELKAEIDAYGVTPHECACCRTMRYPFNALRWVIAGWVCPECQGWDTLLTMQSRMLVEACRCLDMMQPKEPRL